MENKEIFTEILEKTEEVEKVFKPNRKRFVLLTVLRNILISLVVFLFPGMFMLITYLNGDTQFLSYLVPIIISGLVLVALIVSIIARVVVYKHTFYCCTNKRIIIRRGFIGVDYQSLDYDLIGGLDVTVDFLDKIIKPNTGTVSFTSAVSPIVKEGGSSYFFAHIENPYENFKLIKEISAKNHDGKYNS